jgi:hypothetical protein
MISDRSSLQVLQVDLRKLGSARPNAMTAKLNKPLATLTQT